MTNFYKMTFGKEVKENLDKLDLTTLEGREGIEERYNNIFKDVKDNINKSQSNISNLEETFKTKIEELQYKIGKVVEKVRGAVISERGTSGIIYTTQQPITTQHITNKTTATVTDNIVFGVPKTEDTEISNLTLLTLNSISFSKVSNITVNKNRDEELLNFIISPKTQYEGVIELVVSLSGKIRTNSNLIFNMATHNIVEIYRDEELFIEKTIRKTLSIPITTKTEIVKLRIYPNSHKTNSILFKSIGYTDLIYTTDTIIEFKDLNINKNLYQLVVDTCDNSNDKNVSIDYEISINGESYERFSPVSKFNALEKQSIITLDKNKILNMYKVTGSKFSEGDYRYYIPNEVQNNAILKQTIFLPNYRKVTKTELTLVVSKDVILSRQAILINKNSKLLINDKEITEDIFTLGKGIYTIKSLLNETIEDLNITYLDSLVSTYISKHSKDIYTDEDENKYISLAYNDFKESSLTYPEIYMSGIKGKVEINKIKLKITLKSEDKKTVPYVSRILIRGL